MTLHGLSGANDPRRSDLLRGHLLMATLDRLGRLSQTVDDGLDHRLGTLPQADLIQLTDGIRCVRDSNVWATLGRRQPAREVRKGVGGDHDGGDAALLKFGRDVATPRRARASVTGGGDHHIDPLGKVIQLVLQAIDESAGALR